MEVLITIAAGLVAGAAGFFVRGLLARAEVERTRAQLEAEKAALSAQLTERDRGRAGLERELADWRGRAESAGRDAAAARERLAATEAAGAQRLRAMEEKLALLESAKAALTDSFKALSSDLLKENAASFLQLASASLEKFHEGAKGELEKRQVAFAELVAPVRESLGKLDEQLRVIETSREGAYQSLRSQVGQLLESEKELRQQAGNLVTALRAPAVRGRWGELQLRRVVELAGMVSRCDFFEQETFRTAEGAQRPDLLVRLPAGKTVVVDAKAPLEAYLDALEAPSPEHKLQRLQDHARQLRQHAQALSRKAYYEQVQPSPEFVVLFLPGEAFFGAALEQDPSLIEFGSSVNVMFATPTTLIAMLRAVAFGWKEESAARSAKEIRECGAELYKRLSDLGGHLAKMGKAIGGSVEAYNKLVGSIEARVLPSARRLKDFELAAPDAELPEPGALEAAVRPVLARELAEPATP
jgi:DNA recombination protein RmuC